MTAFVTAGVPNNLHERQSPIARMLATILLALYLKTVFESTEDREIRLERTRAVLATSEI